MKSITAAIVIALGLFSALWWGTAPPRYAPTQSTTIEEQRQAQCPSNSRLEGKSCVCPEGTGWDGAHCMSVKVSLNDCDPVKLPFELVSQSVKLPAYQVPQPGNVVWIGSAPGGRRALGIVEAVTDNSMTIIETHAVTGAMARRSASAATLKEAACRLNVVALHRP